MTTEQTKVCIDPACDCAGQPQPTGAFPPDGKGGTRPRCRPCYRIYERLYKARRKRRNGYSRPRVDKVTEGDLMTARFEYVEPFGGLPVLWEKKVPGLRPGEKCYVLR